jgi:hypothetical protein
LTDDDGPLFSIGPPSRRRGSADPDGAARVEAASAGSGDVTWLLHEDPSASTGRADADGGRPRWRVGTDPLRLILALAAPVLLVLGWLLAGTLGVFIVVSAGFVFGLVVIRARLPRGPRRPRRPRRPVPFLNADFPAYRRIEEALVWAPVSARHFDHAVRPLLARLLAAVLAERHGVDMATDPATARRAIGADLWPLVDPARPVSDSTRDAGVPLPVVLRFLDRLGALDAGTRISWEGQ